MKQYVIDELRPADYQKLRAFLDDKWGTAEFGGVYWIPLVTDQLGATQTEHKSCQPFHFAIELEPTRLSCELLIRTRQRIRCDCIGYATETQRNWIIEYLDNILEELSISV